MSCKSVLNIMSELKTNDAQDFFEMSGFMGFCTSSVIFRKIKSSICIFSTQTLHPKATNGINHQYLWR